MATTTCILCSAQTVSVKGALVCSDFRACDVRVAQRQKTERSRRNA